MSLDDPTKDFLDRIAGGAVDTIETLRMEGGHESIISSELGRAAGKYIAIGTLAHLLSLSEQAGAHDEMQAVVSRIAALFVDGAA